MTRLCRNFCVAISLQLVLAAGHVSAAGIKQTDVYARIKQAVDATPAIDTHEHLRGFDELPNRVRTPEGDGMTLHSR